MKKYLWFCFSCIPLFVLISISSFAQKSVSPLPIPKNPCKLQLPQEHEFCVWEMCDCRLGNSLKVDTNLFKGPDKKSNVLQKLKAKTRLRNRTFLTRTTTFGLGYFTDPKYPVHIISHLGEGVWLICEENQTRSTGDGPFFILPEWASPQTEAWAKVTLADHSTGWIEESALNETEGDNCNFDPPLK